jgi:hypothetical protein
MGSEEALRRAQGREARNDVDWGKKRETHPTTSLPTRLSPRRRGDCLDCFAGLDEYPEEEEEGTHRGFLWCLSGLARRISRR